MTSLTYVKRLAFPQGYLPVGKKKVYYTDDTTICNYCDKIHKCKFYEPRSVKGSKWFLAGFRRRRGMRLCPYCNRLHKCPRGKHL